MQRVSSHPTRSETSSMYSRLLRATYRRVVASHAPYRSSACARETARQSGRTILLDIPGKRHAPPAIGMLHQLVCELGPARLDDQLPPGEGIAHCLGGDRAARGAPARGVAHDEPPRPGEEADRKRGEHRLRVNEVHPMYISLHTYIIAPSSNRDATPSLADGAGQVGEPGWCSENVSPMPRPVPATPCIQVLPTDVRADAPPADGRVDRSSLLPDPCRSCPP